MPDKTPLGSDSVKAYLDRRQPVDPEFSELFIFYVRCAEINERLLATAGEALGSPWAPSLTLNYADLGRAAGRMIMRLQQIKLESPELFEAWRKAAALPPGPEGDPKPKVANK